MLLVSLQNESPQKIFSEIILPWNYFSSFSRNFSQYSSWNWSTVSIRKFFRNSSSRDKCRIAVKPQKINLLGFFWGFSMKFLQKLLHEFKLVLLHVFSQTFLKEFLQKYSQNFYGIFVWDFSESSSRNFLGGFFMNSFNISSKDAISGETFVQKFEDYFRNGSKVFRWKFG